MSGMATTIKQLRDDAKKSRQRIAELEHFIEERLGRLTSVTATISAADGREQTLELVGSHETLAALRDLAEQVETLKGLLDARGVEQPEEREPWQPFQKADAVASPLTGVVDEPSECEVWVNNYYTVGVYPPVPGLSPDEGGCGPLVHLSLRRNDRAAIHDWRDLQRIKNELIGPEAEAVEIYPAESRLVDGANQFHLWCFPEWKLPFGFDERLVSESTEGGVTQRQWRDDERPADLRHLTADDLRKALSEQRAAIKDNRENER